MPYFLRPAALTILALTAFLAPTIAQEIKDPNPPAPGASGLAARAVGGPDAFGYTYYDQNEPECPYTFVDISATGTALGDGDDVAFPVALAGNGTFNFYGTTYTTLAMASNGYLSTDPVDTGGDLSNDCPLPATPSTGDGGRMYALHDDLELEPGIGVALYQYFANCPRTSDFGAATEGCHVFQWDDAAHFPGGAAEPTWDIETVLYEDSGEIVHQVGAGNPELGSGSTTGIQNDGATTGLTYACDTVASIPDQTAVCFVASPQPGLLEVPTTSRWGLGLLGVLLAGSALFFFRRFSG